MIFSAPPHITNGHSGALPLCYPVSLAGISSLLRDHLSSCMPLMATVNCDALLQIFATLPAGVIALQNLSQERDHRLYAGCKLKVLVNG